MTAIDPSKLSALRARLSGALLTAEDPPYDRARRLWNGMIDRRPAVIVQCADDEDVRTAIEFSRTNNLPLTVKGGGHGVAGKAVGDGAVMLDLSPMQAITVDPVALTATARGGVTWGPLDIACQEHGLATTGGVVPTTGIAGLTLGGGLGFLMRSYGLSCDNLLAAKVVTADGRVLTASEDENPDLLWGLRGGGGNFGVVTSFTYRLHRLGTQVIGGIVSYPIEYARQILELRRELAASAPDALMTHCSFATDDMGRKVVMLLNCFTGTDAEFEPIARRLKGVCARHVYEIRRMPYLELQAMFLPAYPAGRRYFWKSSFVDGLTDEMIALLIERYQLGSSPGLNIHSEHLGGAVGRVGITDTAFADRDATFTLIFTAGWDDSGRTEEHVTWVRETWAALQPHARASAYINYFDTGDETRVAASYGPNYARLAALKARYDPDNVFSGNQNITPAK